MRAIKFKNLYFPSLLLLSFLFILFSCEVSSPLTNRNTSDSTIFMAMGKMTVEGKIPFKDFFDHKGPSLILLQAIALSFVEGRFAIFLLEIINLFLSLVIISKTAKLLQFNRIKQLAVCTIFLVFIFELISKGNTVEELSFIPLFASLYYLCKYYFLKCRISKLDAFIIGLSFSFILWLRANNAGFIVAICIFMFIATIIDKDYKSLKNLILFFIIGQLPFTLIYLSYFTYHGALYELFYSTFIYNLNYVNSFISFHTYTLKYNTLVFILLIAASIIHYRKEKDCKIFLLSFLLFVMSAVTINMGYAFPYYFLLYSPTFVFAILIILHSIKNDKIIYSTLIIFSFILTALLSHKGYYLVKEGKFHKEKMKREESEFRTLLNKIPENERDKIYYYDIYPTIYLYEGITSNYKYCFMQEWHGMHDDNIYKEINDVMIEKSPPYVMIPIYEGDSIDIEKYHNKEFYKILKTKYSELAKDQDRVIMKLD